MRKASPQQIDDNDEVLRNAVEFFKVYEKALRSAGAIDFADMVPLVVKAMDENPAYAATITGAYDHLLVDEYQDVNPGQVELIDRFVRAGVNLWVVGDDDQTLYAFRAADVRFILDFPQKYRCAQVHVLDRNYRSAAQIVAAAKRLIANNRARRDKNYQPVVADAGEIVIRGYRTPETEARQVARAVAKLLKQGHAPRQIAVLYRVGSVGLALQPALQELQIPYEVRGAGDLWQGVAARLVVGSLYYLRDGESVEAMSRMGSSRRARHHPPQARPGRRRQEPLVRGGCQLVRNYRRDGSAGKGLRPRPGGMDQRGRSRGRVGVIMPIIGGARSENCRAVGRAAQGAGERRRAVDHPFGQRPGMGGGVHGRHGGGRAAARQQRRPGGRAPGGLCRRHPGQADSRSHLRQTSVSGRFQALALPPRARRQEAAPLHLDGSASRRRG